VLPVKSFLNKLIVRVDQVQNHICVFLNSSCPYYYVVMIGEPFKAFFNKGSYVDAEPHYGFVILKLHFDDVLRLLLLNGVYTMNESFIHVKYQQSLLGWELKCLFRVRWEDRNHFEEVKRS